MASKILVIEDNPEYLENLSRELETRGYTVIQAVSAPGGAQKALSDNPDLIVMDLALSGVDGVEATGWLKQHPRTKDIAIIAHAGQADITRKKRALELGADMVVNDPVGGQALGNAVAHLLGDCEASLVKYAD